MAGRPTPIASRAPAASGASGGTTSRRIAHRLGVGWLGVELFAGILALCLLVTVLPALDWLVQAGDAFRGQLALGSSALGGCAAVFLGRAALRLPLELLREAGARA